MLLGIEFCVFQQGKAWRWRIEEAKYLSMRKKKDEKYKGNILEKGQSSTGGQEKRGQCRDWGIVILEHASGLLGNLRES